MQRKTNKSDSNKKKHNKKDGGKNPGGQKLDEVKEVHILILSRRTLSEGSS